METLGILEEIFNFGISVCYFAIPVGACVLCWHRWNELEPFLRDVLLTLAVFISACGLGHLLDALEPFWSGFHPIMVIVHGLTFYVSARAAWKVPGIVRRVIFFMNEKRRITRALQESEFRFQVFSDSSPTVKFIKNVSGEHLWINRRCREVFGNILGHPGKDWLSDDLTQIIMDNDLLVWESPEPISFIEQVPTVDGEDRHWHVVKFALRHDLGYATTDQRFIGGIALDVTQQAEAERKLIDYSAELVRSNQELQSFSYIISHDLKAPLRSIIGFSERLRDISLDLNQKQEKYLNNVLEAANWMQTLIEDLLAFSRVARQEPNLAAVNVSDSAKQAITLLQESIYESNATIINQLPDVLMVRGDSSQLTQVFQNLIGNAIKFVPKERVPKITVQGQRKGDRYFISVADNGIGIDERFLEKVFMLFQRLHNREEYEGTGVGLAICHKIIERHGGTISITSTLDVGSVFTFSLEAEHGLEAHNLTGRRQSV